MAVDEWHSAASDMAVQQFDIGREQTRMSIPTWRRACAGRIGR